MDNPIPAPVRCEPCVAYLGRRLPVLSPEFALVAFKRGVAQTVVAREYMHGVHARHLSGKTLELAGGGGR